MARGHSVTVVTQAEPETPPEETIADVRVLRLAMRRVAGFRVPKGYLRLLRSLEADVLHLTGNRIWNVDYYLPFARSFDWPQVIMPLGFYHYWMRTGFIRWLYYDRYLPGPFAGVRWIYRAHGGRAGPGPWLGVSCEQDSCDPHRDRPRRIRPTARLRRFRAKELGSLDSPRRALRRGSLR